VNAAVSYTLTSRNELVLEYSATTDKATPINLTNHSYFNLSGRGHGDILQHQLTLHAAGYTPTDAGQIPIGVIAVVADTPFDFRTPAAIGARIDADHEQIRRGNGYDHNFVIDGYDPSQGPVLRSAVRDALAGGPLTSRRRSRGPVYAGNNSTPRATACPRTGFCLRRSTFPIRQTIRPVDDSPAGRHLPVEDHTLSNATGASSPRACSSASLSQRRDAYPANYVAKSLGA
jgi:aldose 1-epimerase